MFARRSAPILTRISPQQASEEISDELTQSPPQETVNMNAFLGKYIRTAAGKYEEFLKEMNVGILLRKAVTMSSPVMEITKDGDQWNIKTFTTLKTMELKFKLDEEFDETTPDGREVKAKVSFKDGKMVTVQKAKKEGEKALRV